MRILIFNPISKMNRNVMRDVIYGCWCKGRRIGGLKLPPIGLLLVATVLKKDGFAVTFLDGGLSGINYHQLLEKAKDYDIVISTTSSHTTIEDSECLCDLKKRNPKLFSICFGPQPTFLPELVLNQQAYDVCVRGEPEFIIKDLLRAMRDGQDGSWKKIQGISYLGDDGHIISNDAYPLIGDLDQLPFPDRSLLPPKVDYFNPVALRFPMTTAMISRGCPAKCTFCLSPYFYGKKVRYRSVGNIMEELKQIQRLGYKEVFFRDETFTSNKINITALCEAMLNENMDLTWTANARIGMLDQKMAHLMKKAGCHTIKFGVESGSQEILDRICKRIDIGEVEETFKWLEKMGMRTHAHFMVGHPGENAWHLEKTLSLLRRLRATTVSIGIMTPYPGTPQFDELVKKHPQVLDPTHADFSRRDSGYLASLGCELKPEEIEGGVKKCYRAFYLRPRYLASWIFRVKSVDDIKRLTIAGSQVFQFMFSDAS